MPLSERSFIRLGYETIIMHDIFHWDLHRKAALCRSCVIDNGFHKHLLCRQEADVEEGRAAQLMASLRRFLALHGCLEFRTQRHKTRSRLLSRVNLRGCITDFLITDRRLLHSMIEFGDVSSMHMDSTPKERSHRYDTWKFHLIRNAVYFESSLAGEKSSLYLRVAILT